MTDFKALRKSTSELMDSFIKFATAEKNNFQESAQKIMLSKKKIDEDKIIIMTCGEMRMGKSSFLCALLEDEMLFPVDVDVTTCVITMVACAEKEKITVAYEDADGQKRNKPITREEIAKYAKEQNNTHNKEKVFMIIIETPNERLKDGLVFVDTPGIGSMNVEHSEIVYSFLPRADLVLFVGDSAAPFTAPELLFLSQVNNFCKNIIFILTKKDMQLNIDTILQEKKAAVEKTIGLACSEQIFVPVSSKQKLQYFKVHDDDYLEDSNFREVENEIWSYVRKNRSNILITPRLYELGEELKNVENAINIKGASLSDDTSKIAEMKEQLGLLYKKRNDLLNKNANWQSDVQTEINLLGITLDQSIISFQSDAREYIDQKLSDRHYINQPETLAKELFCLVKQQSHEIDSLINETLDAIKTNFEEESGLTYSIEFTATQFNVNEDSPMDFKKIKKLEKAINHGGRIASNSFRLSALAGVVGGALGGVIGFLTAGPAGAIAGVKTGAGIGAGLGSAGGTIKGTIEAIQQRANYDRGQIKDILSKYVISNFSEWKTKKNILMSKITNNCINSLRETIIQSRAEIEKSISDITKNAQMSEDEKRMALAIHAETKKQFYAISSSYNKLLSIVISEEAPQEHTANNVKDCNDTNSDDKAAPVAANTNNGGYTPPDLDD